MYNENNTQHSAPLYSLVQALHPVVNITGDSWGLGGSPQPSGMAKASCLHFLLHDGICNSSAAFLHSVYCGFYLCCSPGPFHWAPKDKFNICCVSIEKTLLVQAPSKEQNCLPWCKNHTFGDAIPRTCFLQHICNHGSTPHVGRRGLITPPLPSPRVTFTWTQ